MMGLPREKTTNRNWAIQGEVLPSGNIQVRTDEDISHAIAMDLRDEMQALNRVMQCPNVMAGFRALRSIDKTLKRIDKRLAKKVPLR